MCMAPFYSETVVSSPSPVATTSHSSILCEAVRVVIDVLVSLFGLCLTFSASETGQHIELIVYCCSSFYYSVAGF